MHILIHGTPSPSTFSTVRQFEKGSLLPIVRPMLLLSRAYLLRSDQAFSH